MGKGQRWARWAGNSNIKRFESGREDISDDTGPSQEKSLVKKLPVVPNRDNTLHSCCRTRAGNGIDISVESPT